MSDGSSLPLQQSPAPARRPLILVAEDNNSHRFVVRRVFAAAGVDADLRFVANGRALLDYLSRCKSDPSPANAWPHLVLLDLHMPEMGGIEALGAMRADRSLRMLPVIVFSSSDQPRHIDQAYATGANAYLVKAGDFRELVHHLRGMSAFWLQAARLPSFSGSPSPRPVVDPAP